MALKYRERFMSGESMFESKVNIVADTSIYDFFEKPVAISIKNTNGIKISILPNDLLRPAFAQIRNKTNLLVISRTIDSERKIFDYYELQEKLRTIQAEDRCKRLEMLPLFTAFEHRVQLPLNLSYSKSEDKVSREKENRDIEYPYFKRQYPSLTRSEFDTIVNARNAVYHNGIALDVDEALVLLKKLTTSIKRK